MSVPKRHHYVPQLILNNFTDPDGWLYWWHYREPKVVRPARPSELFHQRHLYSTLSSAGVKDPSTENALSVLESEAANVVNTIIQSVRNNRVPLLTATQKRIWYIFFLTQWRRTPDTQQATFTDQEALRMVQDILDDLLGALPHRRSEIEQFTTADAMARIVRNARIDTLMVLNPKVMEVLFERGISILRIARSNKGFIIGSQPVAKLTPGGKTDLNDLSVEMWLPISSDIAVGVGQGDGGVTTYLLEEARLVRQLNLAIMNQSRAVAAASADLVRSITHPR